MAKVVPPAKLDLAVVPGSGREAQRFSGAKQTEMLMVRPDQLHILPDFNLRITGTPEYEAGIRELAESMKEEGFYRDKPFSVIVIKAPNGHTETEGEGEQEEGAPSNGKSPSMYAITDGHRRFAALKLALEEGAGIELVPIVLVRQGTSLEDATIAMMKTGKELKPYELAIGVSRLINAGLDEAVIAKRLGFTKTYVNDLLALVSMPTRLKNLIIAGTVAPATALKAYRDAPKTALERLQAAGEIAKAKGRAKVLPKDIEKANEEHAAATGGETAESGAKSTRGRKPNPLRSEIEFEADEGEEVELAVIAPFAKLAGGSWHTLSLEPGHARIVQGVKITGVVTLKPKLPGQDVTAGDSGHGADEDEQEPGSGDEAGEAEHEGETADVADL